MDNHLQDNQSTAVQAAKPITLKQENKMSYKYNSMQDLRRTIEDMPIETESYIDDYIDLVANEYKDLLVSKGWLWGEETPEVADDEFWMCFECAEK